MTAFLRPNNVNETQWEAICHSDKHLLIVAGPGTGKTHTLVHRLCYLAQNLSSGQKILAITFTHKAADQMQARLETLNPSIARRCFIGTFHQFAIAILRQYGDQNGVRTDFTVATHEQIDQIVDRLWPELSSRKKKNTYI